MPGSTSRWNAKKDLSWTPLRIELVAEVAYEQVQNGRFRHSARLLHWRPDREPVVVHLRPARGRPRLRAGRDLLELTFPCQRGGATVDR